MSSQPIDGSTRFIALLGRPVEHSLSPRIHNTALRALGMNVRYGAFSVDPENLESAVRGLSALAFLGANVTLPYKQAVLPLMDDLSPGAKAVGAVNTIVCRDDGSLAGDNTDVEGFLAPIEDRLTELDGENVVVIGSGGAARAVIYALMERVHPGTLTVVSRNPARAEAVADALATEDQRARVRILPHDDAAGALRTARLVVNATPVGMHPNVDDSPWPEAADLAAGQIVYDLVYNPRETQLLKMAKGRGAEVVGGVEMLIAQAAASFRQWTGREMPVEVVRLDLEPRAA